MKARRYPALFFLVMTLLTAAAIFFFSSQPGEDSSALSDGIALEVAQLVKPDFKSLPPEEQLAFMDALGLVVRKCAHFTEFALLGFNLLGWLRLKRRPPRQPVPAAWGIATLYAGTDEFHQMFVDRRGPALLDVGIDSAGALAGVLLMTACLLLVLGKRAEKAP